MKRRFLKHVAGSLAFLIAAASAHAALTDLSTQPLVTSGASSVGPNLMMLLDDSGSMDWNFLPDWANTSDNTIFNNNGYNGVAYSPAVTYSPPVYFNSDGTVNTTTYKSMTSANTSAWTSVKNDGYGVQSNTSSNLTSSSNNFFYTFVAGEYCDKPNLKTCAVQSAPSVAYPYPATLRWCTSSAMTSCQAVRIETGATTYMTARYPTNPPTLSSSSFNVSGISGSPSVSGITVNSQQIMNAATATSSNSTTLAGYIRTAINACTAAISGSCQVAGYSAGGSTNTVIIYAPAGTAITYTPVLTKSGTVTASPPAFTGGIPGYNLLTTLVSSNNSYPYPGTSAKATSRTDCAGTTCTFAEEMTNYANWWAYYQTRMQMIKTSASLAFQNVGSNYRVGYATINNNQGSAFVNPAAFNATNKLAWYNKFFAASPNNSTPLRNALSNMGRFYAGKYNGSTFNGVSVTDPMQYSCQQNFTILATDGYWNEAQNPNQLDGSTDIAQQDGTESRPFNDGGTVIVTKVTPSVTTAHKQTGQPVRITTQWSRTNTAIGAACSTTGVTPSSCVQDNGNNSANSTRTWCMVNNSSPSGAPECSGSIGSGGAWACRGQNNSTNIPTSGSPTACKTDSGGQNWCVYNNNTTGTSCSLALSGDNIYICKPPVGVTGNLVSTTPQTYNQIQNGTQTSYTATPTTTNTQVVITNGVAAPPTTSTSVGAAYDETPPPPPDNPAITTDTGVPTGSTSWTSGTTVTACTATAALPPAGASTPAISSGPTTANNGAASNTNLPSTGPVVGATVTTTTSTGGTMNTLADVAEYYYVTDLRDSSLGNCTGSPVPPGTTGLDVCTDDVPTSGLDGASWQHMTLFTMALGASGYMQYSSGYPTASSGDYFDVKNGTAANPSAGICSWQTAGACNWPVPVSNTQTTIDDLWHAGVNGRGAYFSATNPATLNAGLTSALSGVSARSGSSAAATTSNPNVTSGDNFVFSSTFTTQEWDGELVRQQLDLATGAVSNTIDWAAQAQLDANTSRVVYTFNAANSNKLMAFNWANLVTTGQNTYFTTPNISPLSQFCVAGVTCLPAASQTAASGAPLVSYLLGDRSNEGIATDTTTYFRQRLHLLGDIVNAEAVYVKMPLFAYSDAGYTIFVTNNIVRQGMVYVAANDGMLHAFNSNTGAEVFTYIPSMVLPTLYKLADKNYSNLHQYFVDGTPVAGDVYFGGAWHTIVVAGLNGGGRGYYALDVTDPAAPKALWEFTDTNMGLTYGNPTITKLQDGTWVVLVTSGYNNTAPGDGVGRLYVLNAATGALIRTISTGVGTTTTPSGLARISAWVDNNSVDNTALRAYGGDMLGNLWRFDINGNIGAAGYDAQLLTTFYANTAGTITQPVTTRPELGLVASFPVVFVGTGRYLGVTDLTDTTLQSFYAVKDALGTTAWPNPRATGTTFVNQALTTTTCPAGSPATICSTGQAVRTSTSHTVNFATNAGWYVDLPDSGERANTDPNLAFGTLGFTTNIPNTSACTAGGYSYRYVLDYRTGAPVSTSTTGVTGIRLGNALATRGVFVRLPNNTVVQLTRLSDGTTLTTNVPIGGGTGGARRVSWRELIQDQ